MADLTKVDPQHPVASSDLDSDKVRDNFAGLIESNVQKIAGIDGGFIRGFQIQRTSATVLTVSPGIAHVSTTAGEDLQKKTTSTTINFATTGVAALDTGTVAADTWYYIWLIRETSSGNISFLASLSTTTPTNPSGWVFKRLIDAWWRGDNTTGLKFGFTVGIERDRIRIWEGLWGDVTADSLFQLEGDNTTTLATLDLSTLGGIPPANVTDALVIYPARIVIRAFRSSTSQDRTLHLEHASGPVGAARLLGWNKNIAHQKDTEFLLEDKNIKHKLSGTSSNLYMGVASYTFHV